MSARRAGQAGRARLGAGALVVLFVALVALVALIAPWTPPARARANGVPTVVPLAYISGLSTWGPQDASGQLELSFAEGYAKLTAKALTPLSNQRYQGWLVNSESNDAISVGRFNASAAGDVAFNGVLPPIADFGFDLFIITVEPEPDDAPQPTAQRSIGGRFSLVGPTNVDGSVRSDVTNRPASLPNTGDPTLRTDLLRMGVLLAAIGVSLAVGLRLGMGRRST